jgi:MSHA biogenesis protein MshQ
MTHENIPLTPRAGTAAQLRGWSARVQRALLRAALALTGLAAVHSAHAATYTFRSDSYAWESAANVISWNRSCTGFPGDDDQATITFTGGFTFTLAGTPYGAVRVLSNGSLQFGADTGFMRTYTNTTLPAGSSGARTGCTNGATARTLMAYWTDLNPSAAGSGSVTWEQKGTAPNRYVVVSWNSVFQYNTSTPYTFQIVLFENGEFKYQYGNANATGANATIGVQVSSTDYTLYSFNAGYNANGSAIRWLLPSSSPVRVAEYRFDEFSYTGAVGEVSDSSGNGHAGVRVGNAASTAAGYVCRGLDVPANTTTTSAAVDTLLPPASAIGSTGSVSMWYRSNLVWTSSTPAMLADATAALSRSFYLMRNGGGALRFNVADSAGTTLVASTAANSFAAGTWVHIAATWRLAPGSNQSTLRLYVNGTLAATTTRTTNGDLDPRLGSLFLGDNRSTNTSSSATPNSANGQLDEVRVYNYEVTAADVGVTS